MPAEVTGEVDSSITAPKMASATLANPVDPEEFPGQVVPTCAYHLAFHSTGVQTVPFAQFGPPHPNEMFWTPEKTSIACLPVPEDVEVTPCRSAPLATEKWGAVPIGLDPVRDAVTEEFPTTGRPP